MREKLEEWSRGLTVEALLGQYRCQAKRLLADRGLPTSVSGLKRRRRRDDQAEALLDVLLRAEWVERAKSEGDLEGAVLNGILLGMAGARADARLTMMGEETSTRQKEARGKRATYGDLSGEDIRARDERMREAFRESGLSASRWAAIHCKEYGLSARQIRRVLSWPSTR